MKIKDHFLTKEIFEIKDTEIPGIKKTFPVPEDLKKYYKTEKYISHYQEKKSIKNILYKGIQRINNNFKSKIISEILPKKSKILDYGSGSGNFIKHIEEKYHAYAYEPNEKAKKTGINKAKNTRYIKNIEEIPNEHLDCITLWHVLEHIEKKEEILKVFYTKLRKEGYLIIALPNYSSYDAKKYKEYWAAYDVPRHIWHISREGMKNMIEKKRWRIKNIKPLIFDAYYISIISEKYKKNSLFWLKGVIQGTISNFKALKSGNYSSLIYIIQKK
ncbi:MAG: class I SAM-dependent methyltransferase [Bergeyella sp.]|nr:class I SAM-dependent methyltransferase [Bergeyella sp.]